MSFSNAKPHISLLLATFMTFFLLLLNKVKSSDSVCFTYTRFADDIRDIIFQGDARTLEGTFLLTKLDSSGNPSANSAGRALFSSPIHLWEKNTGRAASFSTSFSFIIRRTSGMPADGLTFFLVPMGSNIPRNSARGNLGIYGGTSSESFVAVEFDTFRNTGEPSVPHIGIDINNVNSVYTVSWDTKGVPDGSIAFAKITYHAGSTELKVTLTYPNVESSNKSILLYKIDLTRYLPEWVQVGLSAATGVHVQMNSVLSWSFTSDFPRSSEAIKDM